MMKMCFWCDMLCLRLLVSCKPVSYVFCQDFLLPSLLLFDLVFFLFFLSFAGESRRVDSQATFNLETQKLEKSPDWDWETDTQRALKVSHITFPGSREAHIRQCVMLFPGFADDDVFSMRTVHVRMFWTQSPWSELWKRFSDEVSLLRIWESLDHKKSVLLSRRTVFETCVLEEFHESSQSLDRELSSRLESQRVWHTKKWEKQDLDLHLLCFSFEVRYPEEHLPFTLNV